ncbi:Papain family cysteine protease [Marinobacter daqiaonensis]|uniref:Papain family cysteine protease n=1 Tax=Marinobacter daqiaonensis TaxID=650891 RepID=A0A1I6GZS8_9GAMM|nr:C1 family peptidase [Marinobacter daqiaonensis]SFR47670.1 Papain family cysteine protease [Marinobacter daqiaonensis]
MSNHPPKASLNVIPDAPDLRDRYYQPSLSPLRDELPPPQDLYILDQGNEGACTGFGLAATINLLYRFQNKSLKVSPWMLYTMARLYDEWPGEDYEGSSCRGAIKGWQNSGVCLEDVAPYEPEQGGFVITPEISANAKNQTIGAYYRLRPDITDFHAAINEAGVIYASAKVHKGWYVTTSDADGESYIPPGDAVVGGHAFAIVGYNRKGFWIQNSWGEEGWGDRGLALWLYSDWAKHVMDAWVVQMALPTPDIFSGGSLPNRNSVANRPEFFRTVARHEIEHHFVHIDDGSYHPSGRYWSNGNHMAVIQQELESREFDHLLIYAHGGLNSTKASAKRIKAMKNTFLDNGIYPFHIMYDTGLLEELKDVVLGKRDAAEKIAGVITDWIDRRIENLTRRPGRALWREMKYGAETPFDTADSDGSDILRRILGAAFGLDREIKIHIVGHSTGAILHAYLLTRALELFPELTISTCSLLAPAATNELFDAHYREPLSDKRIKDMCIYNLTEQQELDDHVAGVYRKSLLYLVSRAFEDKPITPLLGMQKYNKALDTEGLPVDFVYSKHSKRPRSSSDSHGGFDNDPHTMNDVLKRVLGKKPRAEFTKENLSY